jgi:hypothetical protein
MSIKHLATIAVAAAILMNAGIAGAQSPATSGIDDTDGWKTIVYPIHAWLPLFGADVRLPPDAGGGAGSAKTSGNFNGAVLAGFRVERARLSIEGEFLWAGMSGSVEAPRFEIALDTIAFKVLGGFKIAPALYADGGVRHLALNVTASILDFEPVTWKPGIWQPVVGLTFRPQLSKTVRIFTQAQLGFSGDDSSRSGALNASVEWQPIRHLTFGGGWGWSYLRVDGTILRGPIHLSQTLNGPIITLGIPF